MSKTFECFLGAATNIRVKHPAPNKDKNILKESGLQILLIQAGEFTKPTRRTRLFAHLIHPKGRIGLLHDVIVRQQVIHKYQSVVNIIIPKVMNRGKDIISRMK